MLACVVAKEGKESIQVNTQAKSWVRILLVMAVVAMMLACTAGASAALHAGNGDIGMRKAGAYLSNYQHRTYLARRSSGVCPLTASVSHHKCSDPPHLYRGRG